MKVNIIYGISVIAIVTIVLLQVKCSQFKAGVPTSTSRGENYEYEFYSSRDIFYRFRYGVNLSKLNSLVVKDDANGMRIRYDFADVDRLQFRTINFEESSFNDKETILRHSNSSESPIFIIYNFSNPPKMEIRYLDDKSIIVQGVVIKLGEF